MPTFRNHEEIINIHLATLISKFGAITEPENIIGGGKNRPDVMFQLCGLRVIIEAKQAGSPSVKKAVFQQARGRILSTLAHIAIAVIYPRELSAASNKNMPDLLANSKLSFRIITETSEYPEWITGTPEFMMGCVRSAQELLVNDDIVKNTADRLSKHLEEIAALWVNEHESCDRLSKLFGMELNEELKNLDNTRETTARISALILANAFIFQEQLALSDGRVETLAKLRKSKNLISTVSEHWRWIIEEINNISIFELGDKILVELPKSGSAASSIASLLDEARKICAEQAALKHDLMGRIYHFLLNDKKFLGTYFTSVSAATLLLKVALNLEWQVDFGHPRNIANFKVADLASGTGTLLMAATQALTDNYIKARVSKDESVEVKDLSTLHKALMENCIHGYDILPTAVHLTASTLALLAPDVAFRKMNLYVMPIGVDHGTPKLGSLDFLISDHLHTQLSLDNSHLDTVKKGIDQTENANAKVPQLDLCVMNPPFVRSAGTNKLFGSHPEKDRDKMQKELQSRADKAEVDVNPGLCALFVPLGDKCVKPGGRLAFVLPIAIASGASWKKVRKYLSERYHLEVVITSHEKGRTNFSENTNLTELLFVARKLKKGESPGNTCYVTLHKNPVSIYDALNTASRISEAVKESAENSNTKILKSSDTILGEVATFPAPMNDENWINSIFFHGKLAQMFFELKRNCKLVLPESKKEFKMPICLLTDIGELGYHSRDVNDAFQVYKEETYPTPYPGFWNHDSKMVNKICQESNSYLKPRDKPIAKRPLKDFNAIWQKSASILLVERVRMNTQKVIAIKLDKNVIGNSWWAFQDKDLTESQKKALLIWFNSSLGILSVYGQRVITEGAWGTVNKNSWNNAPVLDVRQLNESQLRQLAKAFDEFAMQELQPLSQTNADTVRNQIDDSISSALKIPKLDTFREMLVLEPGISN